jgi:hypothetical protein
MKKSVFVAAGAALFVALIAFVYYRVTLMPLLNHCTDHNYHCIRVSVDGTNMLQVDVPKLVKNGRNHTILWYIDNEDTQNYQFPEGGIAFKTADGKDVFNCDLRRGAYRCVDRNWKKGEFEYAVKVTGSPTVPPLDPWVFNN